MYTECDRSYCTQNVTEVTVLYVCVLMFMLCYYKSHTNSRTYVRKPIVTTAAIKQKRNHRSKHLYGLFCMGALHLCSTSVSSLIATVTDDMAFSNSLLAMK